MADVFTHAIAGFIIGVGLSWWVDWMRPAHVSLVVLGAIAPDFIKIYLVIPDAVVATTLGIPFSWDPLHRLGGSVVMALLCALVLAPQYRAQAIALFLLGAASHHVLDMALVNPSGYSYDVLWPLSSYHPPSPNLYRSSDRWPAIIATLLAISVWYLRYQWPRRSSSTGDLNT
ncbi:metal-dependent hydrolase [Natronolimnobius sp. AArcel1]|uniref:metal-dependent hydrolase n=1 Tax=Natronolimnobius sp. AArcel1 TaxID=1679093 RepID=UPI0013EBB705|nr:metal-dependent hydrolase [Natronolimnobius sp. AArcel1]NGM71387.1 metal-dependent hydrolase [Natronolimnobius sp. AArcel1]